MNILQTDQWKITGKVKLTAFAPGEISWLLAQGHSLSRAIEIALRHGHMKGAIEIPNLVTTVGKQFIAKRITGQETVGLRYLAIGTGTNAPAITDTKLQTESKRKLLTECAQGDNFFYSSVFLLASECSIHITEGGLFGGAAASATADSGSLLCRFALDYDNSALGYDLTIQHTGEVL